MNAQVKNCPCGSGMFFQDCCQPIIAQDSANTAEQLMRSRYTAFVLGDAAYLLKTWHPDTRPKDFQLGKAQWLGLKIEHAEKDMVTFTAAFHSGNKGMLLQEKSRFACLNQHWRYIDGDCTVTPIKRNALCFCGSHINADECSHPVA